jgi:hypothetical protein
MARGEWMQRPAQELFGPEVDDKPDMEEMWKEMAAKTKRNNEVRKTRGDIRSSSPQFMVADVRVPSVNMTEYEEDQLNEDSEVQRMIDHIQVEERRYVSPLNSPIKEDRKSRSSCPILKPLLTRPGRSSSPKDYSKAVGESTGQARQEMIQIRASERTYDFLQADIRPPPGGRSVPSS